MKFETILGQRPSIAIWTSLPSKVLSTITFVTPVYFRLRRIEVSERYRDRVEIDEVRIAKAPQLHSKLFDMSSRLGPWLCVLFDDDGFNPKFDTCFPNCSIEIDLCNESNVVFDDVCVRIHGEQIF